MAIALSIRSIFETAQSNPQLIALSLCGLITFFIYRYYTSPWRKLPPGPKGLPIVGNALQLSDKQWLEFSQWRKTYGDILYLNAAGQPVIVINSLKIAGDLLDRRATIYSERPRNIVAGEFITGGLFLTFVNHSDPLWRRLRKAGGEALNKSVVHRYEDLQITESLILVAGMLNSSHTWSNQFRRAGASSTLTMVYGVPPTLQEDDPTVVAIGDSANIQTTAAIQGAHWVEYLPWMKYIPSSLAPWKRFAEERFRLDSALFKRLFSDVRQRLAKGEQKDSFASTLIKDAERHKLTEIENEWLSANVFAAGADAVAAVGDWWVLAMILYPETQRRAQAEIDAFVGRSRIPTLADMDNLPYVRAMVKELLRWRPVDPVGVPHRSAEDDWYEGYFIPKDATIIANVWEMNRDPEIHGADAEHFNPARHLDKDGQLTVVIPDTKEENQLSYGFGRRVCLGRHLANSHIFLQIVTLLWAFNMERERDATGNLVPLDVDGCALHGLAVRPIAFHPKFSPRFPDVVEMVQRELEVRNVNIRITQ